MKLETFIVILIPSVMTLIAIIKNFNKWYQRFYPDKFIDYRILLIDNSILDGFHKKGKPLTINKKTYDYNFDTKKTYKGSKSYLFIENHVLPIGYLDNMHMEKIDPEQLERLQKMSLSELMKDDDGFKNFFKDWGSLITLAGIGLLGIMILKSQTGNP